MVEWTDADRKAIATVWGKIKIDVVGPLTLASSQSDQGAGSHYSDNLPENSETIVIVTPHEDSICLIVYPWTQGYFSSFGTFTDAASITGNANVSRHGIVVLRGLEMAVENMDDIKNTYSALSLLHSEKLHVDPDNFRLLFDCLAIVIASKMGPAFTPDIQASWHKFLSVVVSALGKQYH